MKPRASSAYMRQPEPLLRGGSQVGSEEDAEVSLLKNSNYKMSISLSCRSSELTTTKGVLDTCAGPNLVHVRMLLQNWEQLPKPYRTSRRIVDASNNTILPLGVIPLNHRVGNLFTRTNFLVVSNMSAEVILGTSFIDRFVTAVVPGTRPV